MKKLFIKISFLVSVFLFLLTSCQEEIERDKQNNQPLIPPTYESLYISTTSNNNKKKLAYEIPDDVIVSEEQVDHYVNPSEDFYLHILLNNKEAYEILSITILDTKYQSYQFLDTSTSEEIIIKIKAPSEAGSYNYDLNGIKYVYGNSILDVDLTNKDTLVKVGVSETTRPEIYIKNIFKTTYSIKYDYVIKDNLYLEGTYRWYLIKDDEILDVKDFSKNNEAVEFIDLDYGSTYKIVLICYADFFDGNGVSSYLMYEDEVRTYSDVELEFKVYATSISYEIIYHSNCNDIKVLCNGSDVTNSKEILYLEPETTYEIVLSFNMFDEMKEVKYLVKTLSLTMPSLTSFQVESSKTSINYEIILNDVDNIVSYYIVNLYDVYDNLINSSTDLVGSFTNLKSNTIYKVKFAYKYLDEAKEEVKTIKTKTKENIIFNPLIEVGDNSILCNYQIIDKDNILEDVRIAYSPYNSNYVNYLTGGNRYIMELSSGTRYDIYFFIYVNNDQDYLDTIVYHYEVVTQAPRITPEISYLVKDNNKLEVSFYFSNLLPSLKVDKLIIKTSDGEYIRTDFIEDGNYFRLELDAKPGFTYDFLLYYSYLNVDLNEKEENGFAYQTYRYPFIKPELNLDYIYVGDRLILNLNPNLVDYDSYNIIDIKINGIFFPVNISDGNIVLDYVYELGEMELLINFIEEDLNYTYTYTYVINLEERR